MRALFSRNLGASEVASPDTVASPAPSKPAYVHASILTRPVKVLVEEADGVAVAYNIETGIYGSGESDVEAVGDFLSALKEHADMLGRQERLSEPLTAQLAFLRSVLREHPLGEV